MGFQGFSSNVLACIVVLEGLKSDMDHFLWVCVSYWFAWWLISPKQPIKPPEKICEPPGIDITYRTGTYILPSKSTQCYTSRWGRLEKIDSRPSDRLFIHVSKEGDLEGVLQRQPLGRSYRLSLGFTKQRLS